MGTEAAQRCLPGRGNGRVGAQGSWERVDTRDLRTGSLN